MFYVYFTYFFEDFPDQNCVSLFGSLKIFTFRSTHHITFRFWKFSLSRKDYHYPITFRFWKFSPFQEYFWIQTENLEKKFFTFKIISLKIFYFPAERLFDFKILREIVSLFGSLKIFTFRSTFRFWKFSFSVSVSVSLLGLNSKIILKWW